VVSVERIVETLPSIASTCGVRVWGLGYRD